LDILTRAAGHEGARHDRLVAHNIALAKLGAAGAFSTETTKLIEDLVGRAPITTKQFAEDFKEGIRISIVNYCSLFRLARGEVNITFFIILHQKMLQ
jgi:hypothetical protein